MAKMKIPDPNFLRGNKFGCAHKNCDWQGDSPAAYRMHFLRRHSRVFEKSRTTGYENSVKKNGGQNKGDTEPPMAAAGAKLPLINLVIEALKSHGGPMPRKDLIAKVRELGYNGACSDNNLGNSISAVVRKSAEIHQPSRGRYEHTGSVTSMPMEDIPDANIPDAVKISLLQQDIRRKDVLVGKLMELLSFMTATE